jgi:hypothetical protein
VSSERDAGRRDVQLFSIGVGISSAGDCDSDLYDHRIDSISDDSHYDFGNDIRCACGKDTEREPDGDGSSGGLHTDDQQLAAVGDGKSVGDV